MMLKKSVPETEHYQADNSLEKYKSLKLLPKAGRSYTEGVIQFIMDRGLY